MRQEEERLAAGAVAAQPGVDRAASGHGLDDLRLEAGRGRAAPRGSAPRASSPSGASGVGGLIDGIRIRSRSVVDQLVVRDASRLRRRVTLRTAPRAPSPSRCAAGRDRERDADARSRPNDQGQHHREQQPAVVALLARGRAPGPGRGRRRCTAPRGPSPGRSGRARESYAAGSGGKRLPGGSACVLGRRSPVHDAAEQRSAHREADPAAGW